MAPAFAAMTEFALTRPAPGEPVGANTSPLDAEIAVRVLAEVR